MNSLRPGIIATLAGGVVLLIASFLDWQSFGAGGFSIGFTAWDRGLTGFFLLVIAGVAIGFAAVAGFAPQVNLPEDVLGFSRNQLVMALGASTFIFSICMLFANGGFQIGTILAVLASAAIAVGAYMEDQAEAPSRAI